jgi:hypothetical protein
MMQGVEAAQVPYAKQDRYTRTSLLVVTEAELRALLSYHKERVHEGTDPNVFTADLGRVPAQLRYHAERIDAILKALEAVA